MVQKMKTLARVLGEVFELHTDYVVNSRWIAVGNYMGHRIEAKGRTKAGAVARWRQQALDLGIVITRPGAPLLRHQ